ncbi:MAG TPA: COR domain-containing protein [Anaerolineales bacterium]|nr:COR domain-containing protein [Anaerolineales bacterium]
MSIKTYIQEMPELTELPESLSHLTQLQELDLSNHKLTSLPLWLGNLVQLQRLNLSNNQLTALPESLGNLKQLWLLDLSHNQLKTLPESLGQLIKLQSLILSDNELATLPESLGQLTQLQWLSLSNNHLKILPEWLKELVQLDTLKLSNNQLTELPEWLERLVQLETLDLASNHFTILSDSLKQLNQLQSLDLSNNQLTTLPEWLGQLKKLYRLIVNYNQLSDLPDSLAKLDNLRELQLRYDSWAERQRTLSTKTSYEDNANLEDNPLNPELAAAYKEGLEAVKTYLRAKATAQITLGEAKLILVGEGEVGKTCLMDALLGKPWQEHVSTHGIEIKQIKVTDPDSKTEITLNGWDFGGQRVYRPTHQLFFSAPAVYLVVWKPREGPQQGFVKEWIQLIKRREPTAKILVVATHGGPQQRQPDIDRQELWDLFGKETVVNFFFVDSKPDENGKRKGIEKLKLDIARVATELPEVGRSVPKSFQNVREALQKRNVPYLPLNEVLAICHEHEMDDEIARLFITISHRLGHLTHYENDPSLRDIVILRPDWLATAMSYVLDDEQTRKAHGLVNFSRLSKLWNDPSRPVETHYPENLHRVFLRLMERFDLSYRVAGISPNEETNPVSLIAQLVPDINPEMDLQKVWLPEPVLGDIQQTQVCRIVDAQNGQSANAEGLFYQLIVRLHKYSLGRENYYKSVHWQRGLMLDADYNGRALLRNVGNDVHITVRAPYPERFLAMLTEEVKYLVESFWEGLRCDVTVPCLNPKPCLGLFEVEKLIENKRRGRPEQPCPICNEWQSIDSLLLNAPAATQPISLDVLLKQFAQVKDQLSEVNDNTRRILSQIDKKYADFIQVFTDEAKEGPRLFSLFPIDRSSFNPKEWIRAKFRLVLWCEHSRLPLPVLNGIATKRGIYDLDLDREWFKKASPYIKFLSGTLGMVLPVASSTVKLALDENAYKLIEEQLDFGKSIIDATIGEAMKMNELLGASDTSMLEHGTAIRAENASLRELHALLKAKDPGFGGLVRVMNKRQEFLWVHEKFASEY